MRKNHILPCVLVLLSLCLAACPPSDTGPVIQTIEWEEDGQGFVQFSTNDAENYEYMFWNRHDVGSSPGQIDVTMKKVSGSIGGGFGILVGYVDSDNFYLVLISANGGYMVQQISGGTYLTVHDWADSVFINTGLGAVNNIRVDFAAIPGVCRIFINDMANPVNSFSYSAPADADAAFVVTVGSSEYENFPAEPVDVRFKMTAPITIP